MVEDGVVGLVVVLEMAACGGALYRCRRAGCVKLATRAKGRVRGGRAARHRTHSADARLTPATRATPLVAMSSVCLMRL